MSAESTHEEEDETVSRLEHMSDIMISEVCSNPAYAQCLLHIKAYRNYHKEEREEFKERIDVLDERYSRYSSITDAIQILIIVLSAGAAFIQAGNQMFGLPNSSRITTRSARVLTFFLMPDTWRSCDLAAIFWKCYRYRYHN